MADESKRVVPADTIKRLRQIVTLGALVLALAHLLWPDLAIDSVTLVLVAMALVPWLAPIFKSLEFPGGWKVEFQELQRAAQRADAAGLLAPQATAPGVAEFSFQRAADQDPNLALAGLHGWDPRTRRGAAHLACQTEPRLPSDPALEPSG